MAHIKRFFTLVACIGLIGLSGCLGGNSDIAEVTGTVKVDGEPIEYALVSFIPAQGRASIGRTDENGVYRLAYLADQKGALIGEHQVMIETKVVPETSYGGATYDEDGPIKQEKKPKKGVRNTGRKEMLPKKYCNRMETELTASVKKGSNTIDFDLETE